MTPVLTKDGRYLPEVTISKKDCRARPSTYSPAVFTKDGRRARPSLPTLPGTDRTIGRQGPAVRTGRLGTLHLPSHPRRCLTSWGSSSFLMTSVLQVQGRERTAFCRPVRSFSRSCPPSRNERRGRTTSCRPVSSRAPGSPPAGAPDGC